MLPRPPSPAAAIVTSSPFLILAAAATAAISFLFSPRRRRPPMSRSVAFSSPESLGEYLRPRLPSGSLASWGSAPGTKTLANLYLELSHGESSLLPSSDPPLVRTVHVASVRVRSPRGFLLLESRQLLSDGTLRPRHRPLSEKMRPGESIEDAAIRAIREEIGRSITARILPGSYVMRVEERGSLSYPGLPARYVLHSVDAEVDGLPEEDGEFSTDETGECREASEGNAVFVKKHFWQWVQDDGTVPYPWA